jgi:hypothetical protein
MEAQNKAGADWLRWAVGIIITLLVGVNAWVLTYTVGTEHRVTKTESDLATHLEKARDDKAAITARLDKQEDNWAKVLTGISSVQVDVAEIKGYMQRAKTSKE